MPADTDDDGWRMGDWAQAGSVQSWIRKFYSDLRVEVQENEHLAIRLLDVHDKYVARCLGELHSHFDETLFLLVTQSVPAHGLELVRRYGPPSLSMGNFV
jgi:hypothetical protein